MVAFTLITRLLAFGAIGHAFGWLWAAASFMVMGMVRKEGAGNPSYTDHSTFGRYALELGLPVVGAYAASRFLPWPVAVAFGVLSLLPVAVAAYLYQAAWRQEGERLCMKADWRLRGSSVMVSHSSPPETGWVCDARGTCCSLRRTRLGLVVELEDGSRWSVVPKRVEGGLVEGQVSQWGKTLRRIERV